MQVESKHGACAERNREAKKEEDAVQRCSASSAEMSSQRAKQVRGKVCDIRESVPK